MRKSSGVNTHRDTYTGEQTLVHKPGHAIPPHNHMHKRETLFPRLWSKACLAAGSQRLPLLTSSNVTLGRLFALILCASVSCLEQCS